MRIGDSLRPSADQTHQPRSVPQECHRGSLPHSPRLQEAAPLPHLGGRVSRGSGAAAFPPHPAERMLFCLQTPSPSHAQTFVTVAALEDPTLLHSGSVSAVSSLITTSLKPDQMRPWPPTQPAPPASAINLPAPRGPRPGTYKRWCPKRTEVLPARLAHSVHSTRSSSHPQRPQNCSRVPGLSLHLR